MVSSDKQNAVASIGVRSSLLLVKLKKKQTQIVTKSSLEKIFDRLNFRS